MENKCAACGITESQAEDDGIAVFPLTIRLGGETESDQQTLEVAGVCTTCFREQLADGLVALGLPRWKVDGWESPEDAE